MRLTVPGERRHPVALRHAEPGEQHGNRACAILQRRIADPGDRSVVARGDHLGVRVPFGGVVQELVQRQREILHTSVDHLQPVTLRSTGDTMPVFQFHG